jgi:predicted permease
MVRLSIELILLLLVLYLSFFVHIALVAAIDGPFYLVLMIVMITPTANNVMVMVELTNGEDAKEGMARMIFAQYMTAPIILSATVTLVVLVAGMW